MLAFTRFDRDDGNLAKCRKHGVSIRERNDATLFRPVSARYMHSRAAMRYGETRLPSDVG